MEIDDNLGKYLQYIGILPDNSDVRNGNAGKSDYAQQCIQPWSIWASKPELTAIDKDIIKRLFRTKREEGLSPVEARILDYEKIAHDVQERIRQLSHLKGRTKLMICPIEDEDLLMDEIKYRDNQMLKQS